MSLFHASEDVIMFWAANVCLYASLHQMMRILIVPLSHAGIGVTGTIVLNDLDLRLDVLEVSVHNYLH